MNIRTFMSGVIALLPIAATLAIVAWAGGFIYSYFGPGSAIGRLLTSPGSAWSARRWSPTWSVWSSWRSCLRARRHGRMKMAPRLYGGLDTVMQHIPWWGWSRLGQRFLMLDCKDPGPQRHEPGVVFLGGHGSAAVWRCCPSRRLSVAGEPYHVVFAPFAPIPSRHLIYVPAKWVVRAECGSKA